MNSVLCGLPWFETQAEQKVFSGLGYACVYALGPEKGRPLQIGQTTSPKERFGSAQIFHWRPLKVHEIVWTAGPPLARRLRDEIHRLLTKGGRHISGEWFDIPVEFALPAFQVATDNLKIPTFTHDTMLERVRHLRELQVEAEVAQANLLESEFS